MVDIKSVTIKPRGGVIKKIISWLVFAVVLFAAAVVILNIQYFSLQFRLLVLGQTPKIILPKVEQSTATPATLQTQDPNHLWIESLGISVPVVYVADATEKTFQAALSGGVVHYPQTAEPGEFGNCYIFGHSSDYAWSSGAYKTVFALLTKIQPGAEILITNKQGQLFTYKVLEAKVVGPNDVQYLSQEGYKKKLLTLQTSYPIGTALKRYLVRAEIEEK